PRETPTQERGRGGRPGRKLIRNPAHLPFTTRRRVLIMNPMRALSSQARPTADGRRPTLSDSINRLDQILEGLGEAIPATIRDTLRESLAAAVGEGVRAALVEALAADGVRDLLRGLLSASPDPAPKPSLGRRWQSRAGAVLAAARTWIGTKVCSA